MDHRTLHPIDAERLKTKALVLSELYKVHNGKLSKGGKGIAKSFVEDAINTICLPFQISKANGAKKRLLQDLEDSCGVNSFGFPEDIGQIPHTALKRAGIFWETPYTTEDPEDAVVLKGSGNSVILMISEITSAVDRRLKAMQQWAMAGCTSPKAAVKSPRG